MSHHHHDNRLAPKPLLIGCAAMMAVAVTAAAAARIINEPHPLEDVVLADAASLSFFDRPGGGVAVQDAESGAVVAEYGTGEGAFVRIAMRAVISKRRQLDIGPETPFTLGRTASGQLILIDEATDQRLALAAFGEDNNAAFAALLNAAEDLQ